jgi:lysozyme
MRRPELGGRSGRRRPLTVIASVLVVTAIVAAVGWFEVVPRYRPDLRAGERYGIDVSNHQGKIDWAEVASDEVSYVYMKATEGDDFVDKRFAENWSGAASAGLTRGAYHFFTLCSSGAAQAANFLRVLPNDPDALAPAVDLEYSGCSQRPDSAALQRELGIFIQAVEKAVGKEVILYALPSFTKRYPIADTFVGRDRWVRRLFRRPAADGWAVWQVSDRGRVKGINEPTDIDVWAPDAG